MFSQLSFLLVIVTIYTSSAQSEIPKPTEAGKYDFLEPRIVHGHDAKEGEIPYQLSVIKIGLGHICGASLVVDKKTNLQFAITAAHCLTRKDYESNELVDYPDDYLVRGGSINKNEGQTLNVSISAMHSNFSYETALNDIGLLFFHGQFELSSHLHPIDLPDSEKRSMFDTVQVSGWGQLSTTEILPRPSILQTVSLPVVDNDLCNGIYQEVQQATIDDTQFCAGDMKEGSGSFTGDSGGPAVAKDEDGSFLAGVVSGGSANMTVTPGVYTRVLSFVKWTNMIVEYVTAALSPSSSHNSNRK